MILGIDEVGRGPWAGPLVVGAVILGGVQIDGLTDSKKLTKKMREKLDVEIRQKAKAIGLGWVNPEEIDEVGLSEALRLATKRAVMQIKAPYHEIIIDGTVNFLAGTNKEKYVTTIKKADLLVPCVSAASIIAKVARDNYMAEQAKSHPEYGFSDHVGYGTVKHRSALIKHGLTKLHRMSFRPVKKIHDEQQLETTKAIGDDAETVASNHLVGLGHEIIERNWKTKYCEIDIISSKSGVVYFTEVKYRKNSDQGGGISAITPKKLRQMQFAAKLYVANQADSDMRLSVVTIGGRPPIVLDYLELV
jgi:ribonuclease HII